MAKKRQGFISNSSSSSFIISTNSSKQKITVEIDLIEFIKNCGEYDESALGEVITNKDELDKYTQYRIGYSYETVEESLEKDDYFKEIYDDMLKEIENGKTIITCDVGYDKTDLFQMLKNNENIKFIEED